MSKGFAMRGRPSLLIRFSVDNPPSPQPQFAMGTAVVPPTGTQGELVAFLVVLKGFNFTRDHESILVFLSLKAAPMPVGG